MWLQSRTLLACCRPTPQLPLAPPPRPVLACRQAGSSVAPTPLLSLLLHRWVVYVDERNVPHASPDSNHGAVQQAVLAGAAIPASQARRALPVPGARPHPAAAPVPAAAAGRPPPPANWTLPILPLRWAQVLAIKEGLPVTQAAVEYEGRLLGLPAQVLPRTVSWHSPIAGGGASLPATMRQPPLLRPHKCGSCHSQPAAAAPSPPPPHPPPRSVPSRQPRVACP